MDLEDVKKALASDSPGADPNTTFDEFRRNAGSDDPEVFADFLRKSEMISRQTFTELHTMDDIGLELDDATQPDPGATRQSTDETLSGFTVATGRHELIGVIGEGAMGVVHVAKDKDLRRKVAFKAMRPVGPGHPATRRFVAEVQITAQLDHPNIVPVYSLDRTPEGAPAYSMKLVQGITFEELIHTAREQVAGRGTPDEDHVLSMRLEHFLKVCDAVSYAHNKGVVHRDLKPANIMVGRYNEIYVMDWGIARLVAHEDDLGAGGTAQIRTTTGDGKGTRFGAVIGTPAFMSPEQAKGELDLIGPRSDVCSLGLILYELVLLKQAYTGPTANDVLARAKEAVKVPVKPYDIGERVSDALIAIIHRATKKNPIERYPSVEALADDIRRYIRDEPTVALPDDAARKLKRWLSRHPRTIALAMVVVMAGSSAALFANWSLGRLELAQQRAELEEQERLVSSFRSRAAAQGQFIDNHLLRYEAQLERIAGAFQMVMQTGEVLPIEGEYYLESDFEDRDKAPPDLAFSHHYNRPISPTEPVVHVAPDASEEVWREELGKLQALDKLLKEVWLHRPDGSPPPTDPAEQNELVLADTVVMEWSYVATEGAGIISMFPGAPGWDDSYDPRTRPWYKGALEANDKSWSKPYADLMGTGRLISCVKPVYGDDGTLFGVAGVDLEFNYLSNAYMRITDDTAFVTAYLLDSDGRVIVATDLENDPFVIPPTEEQDEGLDYGLFDRPEVVTAANERTPGYVLEDEGRRLLTWTPLHSIGWTYVAIADVEALARESR